MKRRQLVGVATVGLAASLWPAWLRRAFGESASAGCASIGGAAGGMALAAAMRCVRGSGKPLLVLVIPADDREKSSRGHHFGELLNFGSDVQLAPLSRVEVVCATMADLRSQVPAAGAGDPLMVLVSPGVTPVVARQLDVVFPAEPARGAQRGTWEEQQKQEDLASDQRIDAIAGVLRAALGGEDARAAVLAAEVRKRLKDQPPAGTRWAKSWGCGVEVEGADDNQTIGCGMGHVPRKSHRFLYFFTKTTT